MRIVEALVIEVAVRIVARSIVAGKLKRLEESTKAEEYTGT